jgi:hypothetical protein
MIKIVHLIIKGFLLSRIQDIQPILSKWKNLIKTQKTPTILNQK